MEVMEAVADCIDRDEEFVRNIRPQILNLKRKLNCRRGEKPDGKEEKSENGRGESEGESGEAENELEKMRDKTDENEENREGNTRRKREGKAASEAGKAAEALYVHGTATRSPRGFRWHEAEGVTRHANGTHGLTRVKRRSIGRSM